MGFQSKLGEKEKQQQQQLDITIDESKWWIQPLIINTSPMILLLSNMRVALKLSLILKGEKGAKTKHSKNFINFQYWANVLLIHVHSSSHAI